MAETLHSRTINAHQFATPVTAFRPQANSIERQPDHRGIDPMFGQNRSDVGVMMLHGERRHPPVSGKLQGISCRVEVAIQIVSDQRRFDLKKFE